MLYLLNANPFQYLFGIFIYKKYLLHKRTKLIYLKPCVLNITLKTCPGGNKSIINYLNNFNVMVIKFQIKFSRLKKWILSSFPSNMMFYFMKVRQQLTNIASNSSVNHLNRFHLQENILLHDNFVSRNSDSKPWIITSVSSCFSISASIVFYKKK